VKLGLAQYNYESIGYTKECPLCCSLNTYYSCKEQCWCCFDCDEEFPDDELIEGGEG
jgi:hypothetical protein